MKIAIGVDANGAWKPALNLVTRLWPQGAQIHLIHCIESVLPDGSFPEFGPAHPISTMYEDQKQAGTLALQQAEQDLAAKGISSSKRLDSGNPAHLLVEYADQQECDVIVVRSSVKGFWDSTLFGSTAKGVLIGAKQSVLVVKNEHAPEGPVRALIATDHSKYMNQCINRFITFRPEGLGEVTIYTANEMESGVAALLVRGLPSLSNDAPIWIQEKLVSLNNEVAAKLTPFCDLTQTIVDNDHPHKGIRRAMDKSKAELLIMGAQGHGFLDRIQLGSKSHHQVLSEPYSVLVLRVDQPA